MLYVHEPPCVFCSTQEPTVSDVCAGQGADLLEVDGKQMLGATATTAQVMALLNAREGRKQSRRVSTVKIGNLSVELSAIYNAVQESGGFDKVCHDPGQWTVQYLSTPFRSWQGHKIQESLPYIAVKWRFAPAGNFVCAIKIDYQC